MKTLNIPLEDKEYERLEANKGDMNWHDFILQLSDLTQMMPRKKVK